ncbi:MAG: hypothetical protein MUC49_07020 [Raineya sp.]|jgi:hypothetical protein|nr:hypothetical protein [Raineya sp.]
MKFFHIFYGLLAVAAIALWLLVSQNGFGSTVDAQAYWYAAQSFHHKGQFLTPQGYYTNWTPLFPITLSLLGVKTTLFITLIINLILIFKFTKNVFDSELNNLSSYLAYSHTITSVFFILIHFFVWSEAGSMALLIASVLSIQKLHKNQDWAIFIILSNLLCMQRMAGIFFVIFFFFWIWKQHTWQKAFMYGILASLSLLAWFTRNFFIQNKPDFIDNIFMVSLESSFLGYAEAVLNIFLPSFFIPNILKIFFLGIFLLILLYVLWKKFPPISKLLSGIIFSYLFIMIFLRMNVEGESERYIAPIIPIIIFLFWKQISLFLNKNNHLYRRISGYAMAFLVIAYNIFRTYKNVYQWITTPPDLISINF